MLEGVTDFIENYTGLPPAGQLFVVTCVAGILTLIFFGRERPGQPWED